MPKKKKTPLIWLIITAPFRFIRWIFRGIRDSFKKIYVFFTEEEEDTPLPEAFAKTVQNPMGIMYHINELRKHIFRAALYVVITTAVSFIYVEPIMAFMAKPLPGGINELRAVDVTEPVGTVFRVSLLAGFALAFPLIAFEVWLFAAPGLKRSERAMSLIAIPLAVIFFLGGMAFSYYIMLPVALPILLKFMGLQTIPRPSSYFEFVVNLCFWLGVFFEYPLVVFILARLGIVKSKQLLGQWRLAIVIIAIISAAITTTTDPVNMSITMAPMIFLFFLGIGLARIAESRRAKASQS